MRGKTATLLYRYCREMNIQDDAEKKAFKKKWNSLSHKEKCKESLFMETKLEIGKRFEKRKLKKEVPESVQ
jgi:hypothetical protein